MQAQEEKTYTEAFVAGREAGRLLLPPSLNPNPVLSAEHLQWEMGRLVGAAAEMCRTAMYTRAGA
jgi:hypothetical protein